MKIKEINLLSEFDKYDIVFTKGTFSSYKLRGNINVVFLYIISLLWNVEILFLVAVV